MSDSLTQYSAIAYVYDVLNSEVDYASWAKMLDGLITKYMPEKPELVLDLACGTGKITRELSALGYDMIGVDLSADMLSCAIENTAPELGVLYLNQNMCDFELYGTVGAAVCCLDSINYLTEDGELEDCLACVHNYLDPDGIFIFDVNSPYKFESVYSNNAYVLEGELPGSGAEIFCGWQNCFDPESGLCDFFLTVFTENEDGTYSRQDEQQTERCYTREELENALVRTGFELLEVASDLHDPEYEGKEQRLFFVARCKKNTD